MSVGYNVQTALLAGDNTLSLERLSFATSQSTQTFTADSAQLWYVEKGSMRVTEIVGGATIASPATTWQDPTTGSRSRARRYILRPGDALRLDAGSKIEFSSAELRTNHDNVNACRGSNIASAAFPSALILWAHPGGSLGSRRTITACQSCARWRQSGQTDSSSAVTQVANVACE